MLNALLERLWGKHLHFGDSAKVGMYDTTRYGLYDLVNEARVPRGQRIYDPAVFGRYTLSSQKIVPLDAEAALLPDLDSLLEKTQRAVFAPNGLDKDRYRLTLLMLPIGQGLCLDACTGSPRPDVVAAITDKGYEYLAINLPGNTQVREEDLRKTSFADDSVAIILSVDTLEHIKEYDQALREMHRIIHPGGMLFAHIPCYFFGKKENEPIRESVDPWGHVWYFSARRLLTDIDQSGFCILRVFLAFDYGSLMVVCAKLA